MKSRLVVALGISAFGWSCAGTPGDSSDPGGPDAASSTVDAGPFDCFGVINCTNACSSSQCLAACSADGTPTAQSLDSALQDCIGATCPATDGGPCESTISGACQDCVQNAQTAGQPCAADIVACIDDVSGSAGDQTGTGCSTLTNCIDGCQSVNCEGDCLNATSSQGYQLYTIVDECMSQNCSDSDGGPCADSTSQNCASCEEGALGTGGACINDYDNCQANP